MCSTCAEIRDRTGDPQIFGLTLSQLSYRGCAQLNAKLLINVRFFIVCICHCCIGTRMCARFCAQAQLLRRTCGLVAMTSASHDEGRQFDPGQVYLLVARVPWGIARGARAVCWRNLAFFCRIPFWNHKLQLERYRKISMAPAQGCHAQIEMCKHSLCGASPRPGRAHCAFVRGRLGAIEHPMGIEPMTIRLRSECSANCAKEALASLRRNKRCTCLAVLGWGRARRISACGRRATRRRIEFNDVFVPYFAVWSSGVIPASGAGGPGFNSRNSPWFMRIALFVGSAHVAIRKCRQYETWFGVQKPTPVGLEPTRGDPIGLAGRRLTTRPKCFWFAVVAAIVCAV